MSRRKRTPRAEQRARKAARELAGTATGGSALQIVNLASAFSGAEDSDRRGTIRTGTLDTRREVTTGSRKALMRKARWLYNNIGFARRAVDGVAALVGHLTPQAATGDKAWDAEAEERFRMTAGVANVFDRRGKLDFFAWQKFNVKRRLLDGDFFTVLTETTTGTARVLCYEAHEIDTGERWGQGFSAPANLRDGVFVDRLGYPVGYRIIDLEDPERIQRVNARDVIAYSAVDRYGAPRGVTALAHAINSLIDITETNADVKMAIKVAAQLGLIIVRKGEGRTPLSKLGMAGALSTQADPNDSTRTIGTKDVFTKGGNIAELDQGEEIQTLHDARPHPNQQAFQRELIRDIAWGMGYPPEVLWDMAGLTSGGVRYMMEDLKRAISAEHLMLRAICQRFWAYWVAKEIKSGKLRAPKAANPFKCQWIPQADPTIDHGRYGRLELDRLAAGADTLADIYARRGADWEEKLRQRGAEIKAAHDIADDLGIDYAELITRGGAEPSPNVRQLA